MSTHIEWEDYAKDVGIEVMDRETAADELAPDDEIHTEYVLVLSSGGGGAFATGGTRVELLALARKIFDAVKEL